MRILNALFIITFLTGCRNDNDPSPSDSTTLLTFRADPGLLTADTDDWVFITDENGTILDSRQFETDQNIVLTTTKELPTQRVNVTVFRAGDIFTFESYLGIGLQQTWRYGIAPTAPVKVSTAGTFTLNLDNYDSSTPYFSVSNKLSSIVGSAPPAASSYPLANSPSRVLVAAYRNGIPVYSILNSVAVGSTFALNLLTDFRPMEHAISVDLSGSQGSAIDIRGYDLSDTPLAQGYVISSLRASSGISAVGWCDGFDVYKTNVVQWSAEVYKAYFKFGSGVTSAPMLSYTNSITNPAYKNFAFSVSGDYDTRVSKWSGNPSVLAVYWTVFAPSDGRQNMSGLPDELRSKYPFLDNITNNYLGTTFIKYLDGFTYADLIQSRTNPKPAKPYPSEYQVIAF